MDLALNEPEICKVSPNPRMGESEAVGSYEELADLPAGAARMGAHSPALGETVLAARIREQWTKRQAAERNAETLRWEVAEQSAMRVAAQQEAAVLRSAIAHESAARAALQHQADILFSSTSWRLTRPLRAAIAAIRRISGVITRRKSGTDAGEADVGSPDLRLVFDADWYVASYPDAARSGLDPLHHYLTFGATAGYDPCPLFDSEWYLEHNPEIANSGASAIEHYLQIGAGQLRDPHPDFNAAFYVHEHPEAAANPLAHFMQTGRLQGCPTQPAFVLADYLPSAESLPGPPDGLEVDIVIPVYRGLEETRRCIESVLSDPERPPGRIVVVDDCSPDLDLSEWLASAARRGAITLLRNHRNLGFVASINRGIAEAGRRDVVLLNSDTEVPRGWLTRLAAQAHGTAQVGTVTPFSNNATICSYPAPLGGRLPASRSPAAIDAACRVANVSRNIVIPTAIGFCMYIRRDCLDSVGPFDEQAFGRGYGEENDFCMRAAALGWKHLLACDVFVYHAGGVSFGADSPERTRAKQELIVRHPDYDTMIARFVHRDPAKPYRFAITAALFRGAAEPTLLLVSHNLGGGLARHVSELIREVGVRANLLLLQPSTGGIELSIPSLPDHPGLRFPSGHNLDDLVALLQSCNVGRVHVHHTSGLGFDIHELIERLRVPFDFTVHDYFAICPQVHLLRTSSGDYCGEPDEANCNACIARQPQHGARDIIAWRREHAWLLEDADRVICPSEDVRRRLGRYVPRRDLLLVPHEPIRSSEWAIGPPRLSPNERLRIGLIGAVSPHKGRDTLLKSAAAAGSGGAEFVVLGYCTPPIPPVLRGIIRETGRYPDEELPKLIAQADLHVLWFPSPCPESYSYTLTAAIASGLPIVARQLGAIPERVAGRPWTWLVRSDAAVSDWLDAFATARKALVNGQWPIASVPRVTTESFYPDDYLAPAVDRTVSAHARRGDHRSRTARQTVALLPERSPDGGITPAGYVRLLLPLDHLERTHRGQVSVVLVDPCSALRRVPDVLVCQRRASSDSEAERIIEHCRMTGIRLVYDLDEDTPELGETRDFESREQSAPMVLRMLRAADMVWVSTADLQQRLSTLRPDAQLVPSRLDERLWGGAPPEPWSAADTSGPVRILYRGAPDHDPTVEMLEPVALRLRREFGEEVSFEVLTLTAQPGLGPGLRQVQPPSFAAASYPALVAWLTRHRRWHIGVAPHMGSTVAGFTESNRLLEYAGLGLPIVASDVALHRDGTMSASVGMRLVANREEDWFRALTDLVQDARERRHRGEQARDAALRVRTLAAQREQLYNLLAEVAGKASVDTGFDLC
ncbi:MAG: glycosyltransferase [Alphaproteobacteria bacterium]|nr:glycosyltransferase [Alphaproteobacteria bacterium]